MVDNSSSSIHQQLVQALAGNREALGAILTRHHSYLKMLASAQIHNRLRGKADPSDLVQETFLEAYKQIDTFRGRTDIEFTGWLRGILAHLLAKHLRHFLGTQQRDVRLEQSLASELDQASGYFERGVVKNLDSPSDHLMANETMLELANALEALPVDYRTVILLRNIQGMPFKDVAQIMERSVDSVEKLWVRGLARLKQNLDK